MTPTPGQWRHHESVARRDAVELRQWAHETNDPHKKRRYEEWADTRDEYADWYSQMASRGEIEVEYQILEPMREAAE